MRGQRSVPGVRSGRRPFAGASARPGSDAPPERADGRCARQEATRRGASSAKSLTTQRSSLGFLHVSRRVPSELASGERWACGTTPSWRCSPGSDCATARCRLDLDIDWTAEEIPVRGKGQPVGAACAACRRRQTPLHLTAMTALHEYVDARDATTGTPALRRSPSRGGYGGQHRRRHLRPDPHRGRLQRLSTLPSTRLPDVDVLVPAGRPVTFLINPGEGLQATGHGMTFCPCRP